MNILNLLKSMLSPASKLAPSECSARVRSGEALLVDVREPGEWESGVAQSARLLSLSDLNGRRVQWGPFLAGSAGRELVLYCAVGGRAGMAAGILSGEGFRAHNTGGLKDWAASGWPVVKPRDNPPPAPSSATKPQSINPREQP